MLKNQVKNRCAGSATQVSTLEKYVGRMVSVDRHTFKKLSERAKPGSEPDNCFLVAAVNKEMRKLICYGASMRIAVGASDVALI